MARSVLEIRSCDARVTGRLNMTLSFAVVPALDEAASIERVVTEAQAVVDHVIVVDDGSSDDTAALARAAGATVLSHSYNRGVGTAIATGLAEARLRSADVIVQLDGDGQHDASFVPELFARLHTGADLVIGTRFELGFEMSTVRRGVLRIFAAAISSKLGVRVSDPTSGFRAFSAGAADVLGPIFPEKYLSDTVEVLYLAHEHGLTVETVPVRMQARQFGEATVGPIRGAGYSLRLLAIIAGHSIPRRRCR